MYLVLVICVTIGQTWANYASHPLPAGPWTSTQVRDQHNSGEYTYSFDIHAPSFVHQQWEKANAHNERQGAYSFKDAYGKQRIVRYVADKYGFRPVIETNEPGLDFKPSAHVMFAPIHSSSYGPVTYALPQKYAPVTAATSINGKSVVRPAHAPVVIKHSSPRPMEVLASQYSMPVSTVSAVMPSLHTFTWPHSYQIVSTKSTTPPVLYHTSTSLAGHVPRSARTSYANTYPLYLSSLVHVKPKVKIVPHMSPVYTSTVLASRAGPVKLPPASSQYLITSASDARLVRQSLGRPFVRSPPTLLTKL